MAICVSSPAAHSARPRTLGVTLFPASSATQMSPLGAMSLTAVPSSASAERSSHRRNAPSAPRATWETPPWDGYDGPEMSLTSTAAPSNRPVFKSLNASGAWDRGYGWVVARTP